MQHAGDMLMQRTNNRKKQINAKPWNKRQNMSKFHVEIAEYLASGNKMCMNTPEQQASTKFIESN